MFPKFTDLLDNYGNDTEVFINERIMIHNLHILRLNIQSETILVKAFLCFEPEIMMYL